MKNPGTKKLLTEMNLWRLNKQLTIGELAIIAEAIQIF